MTPRRIFYLMNGVNILLVTLIIGGVVGGNLILKQQSEKLTDLKSKTKVVEEEQISLTQAEKDIVKYKDLNSIARSIVPQDKDQAKTVREISKFADETGIKLKDISFATSSLGSAAPVVSTPQPATEPATTALPPLTQVKPVDGLTGVYSLEIIITSSETQPVKYENFLAFLEKLEANRRTAHVAKILLKPSNNGSDLSFSLTLNAYVKP